MTDPNLDTFISDVDRSFSDKLNNNFSELESSQFEQGRQIISDSLLYEQEFGSLGVSQFTNHGAPNGSVSDLNNYKFEISDSVSITSVRSVWCENNKDISEFYVIGEDSSNAIKFIHVDVNRSEGTAYFTLELTIASSKVPNPSGFTKALKGWKSDNGDYILLKIAGRRDALSETSSEVRGEMKSYNSDGEVITSRTNTFASVESNDSNDGASATLSSNNTFATQNSGDSVCGGFWEAVLDNESTNDEDLKGGQWSVEYNDSSQSFSTSSNTVVQESDNSVFVSFDAAYQRGNKAISVLEYSYSEDNGPELDTVRSWEVDLTDGSFGATTYGNWFEDDYSSASLSKRHQDFIKGRSFTRDSSNEDWYEDGIEFVLQGRNRVINQSYYWEDGEEFQWAEEFALENGYMANVYRKEDIGTGEYQIKDYCHRDGTTTTENLTPQYSLRNQDYWFDDGSDRYGFNVNGTTVELDFAATTKIETSLSISVDDGDHVFVSGSTPYTFSKSYVYENTKFLVEDVDRPMNKFTSSQSSVDVSFSYDGGVLKSQMPLIGTLQEDET